MRFREEGSPGPKKKNKGKLAINIMAERKATEILVLKTNSAAEKCPTNRDRHHSSEASSKRFATGKLTVVALGVEKETNQHRAGTLRQITHQEIIIEWIGAGMVPSISPGTIKLQSTAETKIATGTRDNNYAILVLVLLVKGSHRIIHKGVALSEEPSQAQKVAMEGGDKGNSDDDRKPSAKEKVSLDAGKKRRRAGDAVEDKPKKRRPKSSAGTEASSASEEAAVPGETKRERRRRMNRASAKKKRAMKMEELEYMQGEEQRLKQANQTLRTDNDNLRERISMIKRYLPQSTSQAASGATAAAAPGSLPTAAAAQPPSASASASLPFSSAASQSAFMPLLKNADNQGAGPKKAPEPASVASHQPRQPPQIPQHVSVMHPSSSGTINSPSFVHEQSILHQTTAGGNQSQAQRQGHEDEEKSQTSLEPLLDIIRQQQQNEGSQNQGQRAGLLYLQNSGAQQRRDPGEEKTQYMEPLLEMLRQRQHVPLAGATTVHHQLQSLRGMVLQQQGGEEKTALEPLLDILRQRQQNEGNQDQAQAAAARNPDHRGMLEQDQGSISIERIAEMIRAQPNPGLYGASDEARGRENRLLAFRQAGHGGDRSLPPDSSLVETLQRQIDQQNLQQLLQRDAPRLGALFLPQETGSNTAQMPPSLSQGTLGPHSGELSGLSQRDRALLVIQLSQQQQQQQQQTTGSGFQRQLSVSQQQQMPLHQQPHDQMLLQQLHEQMLRQQQPSIHRQQQDEMLIRAIRQPNSQPQTQADQLRQLLSGQPQAAQLSSQVQQQFQPQPQRQQAQQGQMQQLLSLMASQGSSLTNPTGTPQIQPQIPAAAAANNSNLAAVLSSLLPGQSQSANPAQNRGGPADAGRDNSTIYDIIRLLNRGGNPPPPG